MFIFSTLFIFYFRSNSVTIKNIQNILLDIIDERIYCANDKESDSDLNIEIGDILDQQSN